MSQYKKINQHKNKQNCVKPNLETEIWKNELKDLQAQLIKTKKKLSATEKACKVEKDRQSSMVINHKHEINKFRQLLKSSEKTLPPEKILTRCTKCKTSQIVEDLKRGFAKEMKDKNRQWQHEKIELERKILREQKEREKKIEAKYAKLEKEIAGIIKRHAEKLEKANQLRKEDQTKIKKLHTKMSTMVEHCNKTKQADEELKRKLKMVIAREEALGVNHKEDVKKLEVKYKGSLGQQKKFLLQLKKAKQNVRKLSEREEKWGQKEAKHIEEMKELKIQHEKILKQHIKQEKGKFKLAKQQMNRIAGELEESNTGAHKMQMELVELKNKLEMKEQELEAAVFQSTNLELAKLDFERDWEEREKKIEKDFELLLEEKVNAIYLENDKENKILIEDYKKEMIATEKEHQAALHREKEKFDHTFQQLDESHHEIRRQEICSYEKKIQEMKLDMEEKEAVTQINSEKQIRELQERYDDACAEQKELHLKYESQITLIKQEYDEKMVQMDVMLKKNLRDKELKFDHQITTKDNEYQEKLDTLTAASEEKLIHCRKTMDMNIKTLRIEHQCTVKSLTKLNTTNEKKWTTQFENVKKEMSGIKKENDTVIAKLNQELTETKAVIVSLKQRNQKKINFLNTALKLQSSLERERFANAKKEWEKELHEHQQLLDVARVSLEQEKFINDQNCKKLHNTQELREKEKKQATMEINALRELHKEDILKLECEREVERKESLEKTLAENAVQQEMRAHQHQLTEELEALKAEKIHLIDDHREIIQIIKEKNQTKTMEQKEIIVRLEDSNKTLLEEIEEVKKQLRLEEKSLFDLMTAAKEQENKDQLLIKELQKKLEKLRAQEAESRQRQKALEERFERDLHDEIASHMKQFSKEGKELSKQYSVLQKRLNLREKQHHVESMKKDEKIKKERRELQKIQQLNQSELNKYKEKIVKESNKKLELAKKQLRIELEKEIEGRVRSEYHNKMSWMRKSEKPNLLSTTVNRELAKLEKHLPIKLKETDKEGVYTFGARKIHLVIIDGRLSVRVGGGYLTFSDFVNKYGEFEAGKLKKAAHEKNVKSKGSRKYISHSQSLNKIDRKHKYRMTALDFAGPLTNRTNLQNSRKSSRSNTLKSRKRLSFGYSFGNKTL